MVDKDLYIEKRAKKHKDMENSRLEKEIEDTRNILNRIVIDKNRETFSGEVIGVSKKLDELIVKYMIK